MRGYQEIQLVYGLKEIQGHTLKEDYQQLNQGVKEKILNLI